MKIRTIALMLTVVAVASLAAGQPAERVEVRLKAAMHQALVDGDLQAAIEQYADIVARAGGNRTVAAQALLQMGHAYEKLGSPEALRAYERVLRDYPDQVEAVAAAQTRLEPPAPSPAMTVREVMRSDEQAPSDISYPTHSPYFAVSGDGQTFVYRDPPTGDLAVRNMATGEARLMYGIPRNYTGDEQFRRPILSRDGKKVAFMVFPNSAGSTRVEVDSLGGGHRETLFDFGEGWRGTYLKDWSPDGAKVLLVGTAADRSRFLATVSLEDKTLRRLVTLDWGEPFRAEYSPDGRFIAYDSTKRGDSKIYLMSADGAEERVLVDSSGEDDSPLWTRDGRFLLFRSDRSGKWDLYALPMRHGEPAGEAVVVKSNLGEMTRLRAVTAEGQLVYFEGVGGFDVAIAERIDRPARTVHASILPKWQTIENKRPSFAPDGRRVVYVAGAPGSKSKVTIRVTDLEGKILTDIPLDGISTPDMPTFSPDGKRIAFRGYDVTAPRLMVLSAETGTVVKVFSPLEEGYAVVRGWSSDSRLLHAFVAGTGEPFLATIDVDTEQVVDSTVLPDTAQNAVLSPSGTHLAMVLVPPAPGQGPTQLVLRSLEDGSERLLTEKDGPYGGFSIVWDHDSRHLMYRKSGDREYDPPLYSFSLDTEEETVLVEDMENLHLTAVSPDGRYWALEVREQRDNLILALENFLPEEPASPKGNEQGARR